MKSVIASASIFAIASAATFAAVSAPYSNDFSTSVADFTQNGSGWSLDTVNGRYISAIAATNTTVSSTVQATGISAGFSVSTTFTITSNTNGTHATNGSTVYNTIGFGALGNQANMTSGGNYYLADVATDGSLRILKLTNGASDGGPSVTGAGALTVGTNYTLTLTGIPTTGTGYNLVLTLFNSTGGVISTVSSNVAAGPTGDYFGLRDRTNGNNAALTTSFDNFTINAVPEPSSLLLGSLALAGAVILRRR